MTDRTFSTEFLKNDLDLPYAFKEIQFIETHRWYDLYLGIFDYEGVNYGVEFCDPKTELQEDMDAFYDAKEVVAREVKAELETHYVWRYK